MTPSSPDHLHRLFESLWLGRRFPEALPVAEEEWSAARAQGGDSVALLRALLDMALARKSVGDAQGASQFQRDAEQLYARLSDQARRQPRHGETADLLIHEAEQLWPDVGDHPEVRDRLDRAQKIREERCGPDHPLTAEVLARRAEIDYVSGAWAKAAPLFRWALAIFEKAGARDNLYYAKSLQGLAQCLAADGSGEEADTFFERAIALQQPPQGDRRALYFLLIYRAELLDKLNRSPEAVALRERAEELLPRTNPGAAGYHAM